MIEVFEPKTEAEPNDFSDLVIRFQVCCIAISFWEPMSWNHPALQQWLFRNQLLHCRSEWDLPASALWVVVQNLENKLELLQAKGSNGSTN